MPWTPPVIRPLVLDNGAANQLDALANDDWRYQDEAAAWEFLIGRDPTGVGQKMLFGDRDYYLFRTTERENGPPPVWVSYTFEHDKTGSLYIRIFDIRQ